MKKTLLTATAMAMALALFAGSALASDLPSRKEAPIFVPPPPPPPLWTGFYVGANAGAGIGNSEFADPAQLNGVAGLPGVGAGYNWQLSPNWVAGLETDIAFRSEIGGGSNGLLSATESDYGYLGTLRPRLGYLVTPTLLLYGTGGLAYGNAIAPKAYTGIGAAGLWGVRLDHNDTLLPGWTAGGGVEWMFHPNWSVKVEYLYVQLAHSDPLYLTNAGVWPVCDKSAMHVVRAGINYHFNWGAPAPILASY